MLDDRGDGEPVSRFRMPFIWTTPRVLAALWLALAILLCWMGTLPDQFLIRRGFTAPQPYPFLEIAVEIVLAALSFSVVGWGLMATSWARIGKLWVGVVVVGSVAVLGILNSMHAPGYIAFFALAMFLLGCATFFAAVSLLIVGLAHSRRR